MIEIPDSFGDIIRRHRKTRKLTLQQVSKSIEIDVSLLSKIERSMRLPSPETVDKLAGLYEVDRNELYTAFRSEKISRELESEPLAQEILKLASDKIDYRMNYGKVLPLKEDIIPVIVDALEPYPVKRAWLFGAYVRDEQDTNTKVQVVVEYAERTAFLQSVEIKNRLESLLKLPVDINEYALMKFISEKEFEIDRMLIVGEEESQPN